MVKFVLRLDDICPTMSWRRFEQFAAGLQACGLTALLGVVPDCKDPQLQVDAPRGDFWGKIRDLAEQGWTVAQHGCTHVYDSDAPNLIGSKSRSEFAGHPLDVQQERLKSGASILAREGLATDVFMAPGHSYDETTLVALRNLGFRYVTDGYGLWPYREDGLTFVPQLFASPLHVGFGTYTICLHLNSMSLQQIDAMLSFASAHRSEVIDFRAAEVRDTWMAKLSRTLTEPSLKGARALRSLARA